MRIFYLNPSQVLTKKEIAKMARVPSGTASKETKLLLSLGFLKKSKRFDEVKRKGKKPKTKKVDGFLLAETFPLFSALRNLMVVASPASRENILNFFKKQKKNKTSLHRRSVYGIGLGFAGGFVCGRKRN